MKRKMYHISCDPFNEIEVFNPCIPKSRLENEDNISKKRAS